MNNPNRASSDPRTAWMKYATGLALGVYLAGFISIHYRGFQAPVHWPDLRWFAICLGAGLVAAAVSYGLTLGFLRRYCGMARERAVRNAAFLDLSWWLLPVGLLFYPLMEKVGMSLNLEVLGRVFLIPLNRFVTLQPGQYLFLLWAGPWLILSLFLKMIFGLRHYLHHCRAQGREPMVSPSRLFWIAALFFALLGSWASTVYPPTGDEPHYLLMAESLFRDHDIDLSNNMENRDFRKFYPAETLDFHGLPGKAKPGISKHFPALPLILAPLTGWLGLGGALLIMVLAAAGVALCIYALARQWGQSRSEALTVWMAALLTAPLGVYFNLVYPELLAALLILLGLLAWQRGGESGLWGMTLAVALLPWLYPKYIPQALLLFFLSCCMLRGIAFKERLVPGLVLLASGALYWRFFSDVYGFALSDNPYGVLACPVSWQGLRNGLGLLVDRDFGVFATAPVFLLAAMGWKDMQQRSGRVAAVLLAVFAVQWLLYVVFDDFTGSAAVFSRQMIIAVLPLWPLTIWGWNLAVQQGRLSRLLAFLAVAWSMAVALASAAWPFLRYLAPKLLLWKKLGLVPALFPSMIVRPGWPDVLWACLGLGAMAFWIVAVTARRTAGRGLS